jgi:hypothetical protein
MHYEAPEAGIAQLPQGWRSSYCRRRRLDPIAEEPQGAIILGAHYAAAGMVSIIRRVQVGPFAFDSQQQTIDYIKEPQWWDLGLSDPPPPGQPPRSYWRWWIAVESSDDRGNQDEAEQPFAGQIIAPPPGAGTFFDFLSSQAPPAWPPAEISGEWSAMHQPSAFYCVRGPRWFVLIAEWDNRQLIQHGHRYRIATSFGAMEGIDIPLALLRPGSIADIIG